jgi:hypothetical protein
VFTAALLALSLSQPPPPSKQDELAARLSNVEARLDSHERRFAKIETGIEDIKSILTDPKRAAAPGTTPPPAPVPARATAAVRAPATAVPGGRVFVGPGGFWYTESTDPETVVPYTLAPSAGLRGATSGGCAGGACGTPQSVQNARPGLFGNIKRR